MPRNIFFTGDHHFEHRQIIAHDNRPFNDVDQMTTHMIGRWNTVVPVGAEVYHLGDLTMRPWPYVESLLHQLNGHLFLVPGNHDREWVKKASRLHHNGLTILPPIHELTIQGLNTLVLCHYPLCTWHGSGFGTWHLHGHCHGKLKERHPRRLDMWVGNWDYGPAHLDQVVEQIQSQRGGTTSGSPQ